MRIIKIAFLVVFVCSVIVEFFCSIKLLSIEHQECHGKEKSNFNTMFYVRVFVASVISIITSGEIFITL